MLPILLCDFYKCVHAEMYPKGMTKIYSPYTPRMTRLIDTNKVTYFGGQAFCKEYLINTFNKDFFSKTEEEVVTEYERVLKYTLGEGTYNSQKIRELHQLGYLPIAVYAVPEGIRTQIGVPQSVFVNTHPNFAWLTNALETMYSCYMWHTQVSAEVGYRYRQIVDTYKNLTCDDNIRTAKLLGDFSMRGQHSVESAMKSSAGWLLSFLNTATIPAICWLEDNYNCDISEEEVGFGAISTEHSVMCSNYAVDGDEITFVKRLLTEIYPNSSFSMVSDSYDFWNLVTNILPQCRTEIENHNGCMAIRGDSGDPVKIIAGENIWNFNDKPFEEYFLRGYFITDDKEEKFTEYVSFKDKLYKVYFTPEYTNERGAWTVRYEEVTPTPEIMGLVWTLDQIFGHTLNTKGYKVLPPYIKALYGDSITPQRCQQIYQRLADKGYAISNVTLGVGSFSFMCLEEDNNFKPYTRDTFGIAIKATYGEDASGNPIMIYKNPKELSWKKSQKGCIIVSPNGESYTDEHTFAEAHNTKTNNLLQLIFEDGKMVKEQTLSEIRNRMYPEGF